MLNRTIALIMLLLLSPVFLAVIVLIIIDDGLPVLFIQKRVGINYTFFNLYKFRSMKKNTPNVATHLLENPDQYLLKIGKTIRKLSLDELPNLINIIKGDMVFVGPRPALYNQDDLMQLRINAGVEKLKPGLTGWAQINGRDEISLEEKVKLEKEYLDKNQERFLNELLDWLRIPSISADPAFAKNVHEAAAFVAEKLKSVGADNVSIEETAGYPIVYADKIIDFLEKDFGMEGLSENIEVKEIFTPEDFQSKRNNYIGSAWGIEPRLTQTASFRPANKDKEIDNFYIVGASTHPGAGVPGVLLTAEATEHTILEDFGLLDDKNDNKKKLQTA